MPRVGRLDAPGVVHHIMIRGIERPNIFTDDIDREEFLAQLATAYVDVGSGQGRRRDLMGGGLVRSLGGWAER